MHMYDARTVAETAQAKVLTSRSWTLFLVIVHVVLFRARGDVVDIEIVVCCTPVFVRVIQAADRTLIDRPSGATFFFALRLPFVFWRRVRPEVAVARGSAW